jgi:hypothetical protein
MTAWRSGEPIPPDSEMWLIRPIAFTGTSAPDNRTFVSREEHIALVRFRNGLIRAYREVGLVAEGDDYEHRPPG